MTEEMERRLRRRLDCEFELAFAEMAVKPITNVTRIFWCQGAERSSRLKVCPDDEAYYHPFIQRWFKWNFAREMVVTALYHNAPAVLCTAFIDDDVATAVETRLAGKEPRRDYISPMHSSPLSGKRRATELTGVETFDLMVVEEALITGPSDTVTLYFTGAGRPLLTRPEGFKPATLWRVEDALRPAPRSPAKSESK